MEDLEQVDDEQRSVHVREVYARYGLALYHAQVLEHGIVNALVVLDLIPAQRHLMRSQPEWEGRVDAFMDGHFEATMGQLMARLRAATAVPAELERLLRDALARRNRLAHRFFRDNASVFLTSAGRDAMLGDVDECRACFERTDHLLESVVAPVRKQAGITDAMIEQAYRTATTTSG